MRVTESFKLFLRFFFIFTLFIYIISGCRAKKDLFPEKVIQAQRENRIGVELIKRGEYDKAIPHFLFSLRLNRCLDNIDGVAVNLLNIAYVYEKKGDYDRAKNVLSSLISTPKVDPYILSEAFFIMAKIYLGEGELKRSEDFLKRSKKICKENRIASRLNLFARIKNARKDYKGAVFLSKKALQNARKFKDYREEANSYRTMGMSYMALADYKKSFFYFKKALEIDKKLGESGKIAQDLIYLAKISYVTRVYEESAQFYERAYLVKLGLKDFKGAISILKTLVSLYRELNDKKMTSFTLLRIKELKRKSDETKVH